MYRYHRRMPGVPNDTHVSEARKVSTLERQVRTLEEEVDVLKGQLRGLKDRLDSNVDMSEACYYAPHMPGYEQTSSHFLDLSTSTDIGDADHTGQLDSGSRCSTCHAEP